MKNKRGDVSETIIWFGALLAIIFIMLIFLGLTLGSFGIKKISRERNEILMNKNFMVLKGQNELITMLNSPLSDKMDERQTIGELIIEWKLNKDESLEENLEEKIKKEIVNFFKDKSMNYKIVILINSEEKIQTGMKNVCVREYEKGGAYKVPCSESEIFLLAGDDKIKIKLLYEI